MSIATDILSFVMPICPDYHFSSNYVGGWTAIWCIWLMGQTICLVIIAADCNPEVISDMDVVGECQL